MLFQSTAARLADAATTSCTLPKRSGFFGIPTWYEYLPGHLDIIDHDKCIPSLGLKAGSAGNLTTSRIAGQISLIALAVVDILLYVAGIVVVGYMIYGAFLYMTSEGQSDRTANAKNTILNSLIGLVIVFLAITIVSFIGGRFS